MNGAFLIDLLENTAVDCEFFRSTFRSYKTHASQCEICASDFLQPSESPDKVARLTSYWCMSHLLQLYKSLLTAALSIRGSISVEMSNAQARLCSTACVDIL